MYGFANISSINFVFNNNTNFYILYSQNRVVKDKVKSNFSLVSTSCVLWLNQNVKTNSAEQFILFYLFIWGFTLLSTLYRSYHDG